MSQKYTVMALDRRSIGHPNYFRAGRSWPSGQEVEIEVLDQDEDPVVTEDHKGEKRTFVHPTQIGRKSWEVLRADKQLIKQPVGATVDEALQLQEAFDQARAELARTVTRAEMAEKALAEKGAALAQAIADHNESVSLWGKDVSEMKEQLQVATVRAESAEQDAGRLTQERDDLLKQLEQLTAPAETKAEASNKGKAQKRGG